MLASYETPTYLKCNERYYELTGTTIKSNYNVRTKKIQIFNLDMVLYE